MANEEIIGGIISALSRGEPLEKAMMTFYNAGYKKEEIEGSAKVVYTQLGPEAMGVQGSLQDTLKTISSKVELAKKKPEETNPEKLELQNLTQEEISPNKVAPQNKSKSHQDSLSYEKNDYGGTYQNADEITNKIMKAIKDLKPVNFPSRIEIVSKNADSKAPAVVQRVSNYSGGHPKSVSKAVTYLLVFLLILLLGILAAVFFFKDELIKLFNNLGLG
jgi:hypothetical protein